ARTFENARGNSEDHSWRIIGPTFSGSLYSLAQLVRSEFCPSEFHKLVIRSGTVSSWSTEELFERYWLTGVNFATFQQSDRYMIRKFLEFQRPRGYKPQKIAVLSEDETAYGNEGFGTRESPDSSVTNQTPGGQNTSKGSAEENVTIEEAHR